MSRQPTPKEMDHCLEEYLYRNMILHGVDFLRRDYETERVLAEIGRAQFVLSSLPRGKQRELQLRVRPQSFSEMMRKGEHAKQSRFVPRFPELYV